MYSEHGSFLSLCAETTFSERGDVISNVVVPSGFLTLLYLESPKMMVTRRMTSSVFDLLTALILHSVYSVASSCSLYESKRHKSPTFNGGVFSFQNLRSLRESK